MLLSRIHLSPEAVSSRELGPMLASPYRLHKAVWSLFADHADRRRDFLYRLDWDSGRPMLWTLSDRPPRPVPELWDAHTRELKPVLRSGERLRFSLRANPVVTREGKRHDVVMEAKQRLRAAGVRKTDWPTEAQLAQEHGAAWLARHAAGRGFALEPSEILVDSYEVHTFQKPRGKEIRFATCDFHGLLTVTEVDSFLQTLHQGVGPAKGFGCGLFLIRRAS
ncbi:MAG TPA: type I-E CRISPR-associated protein Cas6/Cse3/CasE [Thermoanaerobaculia bacterium]|nr:type I-E CRISPR-associated protein Cas6/Cse3/CasE [Thermoanaerobaculia bacterium]